MSGIWQNIIQKLMLKISYNQLPCRSYVANHDNTSASRVFALALLTTFLWLALNVPTSGQQQSDPPTTPAPAIRPQPPAPSVPGLLSYGNQISLNSRSVNNAPWFQRQATAGKAKTYVTDAAFRQLIGADLLNTSNVKKQPVDWFFSTTLSTWLTPTYRYVDITDLAVKAGWQLQVNGNQLVIATPPAKVANIRQGKLALTVGAATSEGIRLVVDLDRPSPWQITQQPPPPKPKPPVSPPPSSNNGIIPTTPPTPTTPPPPNREWVLTIDATVDPTVVQRYPLPVAPTPGLGDRDWRLGTVPSTPSPVPTPPPTFSLGVVAVGNQTNVNLSIPAGLLPRVSTLSQPNRIVIDIRPDAMVERDILWAQGLRWQQQYVSVGTDKFPVVLLNVNPRTVGLTLKPIVSFPQTLVGTTPLLEMAPKNLAAAAINGGFFNRNNRLPLGAIRRDGRWLSSPILNRGAIAWNNSGQVIMDRLTLQETLITSDGQRSPILYLNSGYVQPGFARYTPDWGANYTPLTDNENIFVVQNNQVISQVAGGIAAKTAVPIPTNGYLLTFRGNTIATNSLQIGTFLRIETTTLPADFNNYPNIIGAGPLLLQNRQIVLDPKVEKFSAAFIAEKATRSIICTLFKGDLLIVAVGDRVGGVGPTLAETAQITQQMGCITALNLDGGSSTSLYLGGQLLNRSPRTAARVHNGIGIFLQPTP